LERRGNAPLGLPPRAATRAPQRELEMQEEGCRGHGSAYVKLLTAMHGMWRDERKDKARGFGSNIKRRSHGSTASPQKAVFAPSAQEHRIFVCGSSVRQRELELLRFVLRRSCEKVRNGHAGARGIESEGLDSSRVGCKVFAT